MRNAFLGSVAGLLIGAGLVLGQPSPEPALTAPPQELPAPTPLPSPAPLGAPPAAPALPGGCGMGAGAPPCTGGAYVAAKVEYLLWWLQSPHFIGPVASTDILGVRGSAPLFGQRRIPLSGEPLSGGRVTLGYYVSDIQYDPLLAPAFRWGVEANYFDMGRRLLTANRDSAPVIFRPFFDLNDRRESALVVAAPGFVTGSFLGTNSFDFMGAEANAWKNVFYNYPQSITRVDVMLGFRYFQLNEDFQFKSVSNYFNPQPLGSPFAFLAGDTLAVSDLFATRNRFLGPQVGSLLKFFLGDFDLSVATKLAVGWNDAEINIQGNQVRTAAGGARTVFQGGLLALPTNIGRHDRTLFAWMPEISANINAHLTSHITFNVGYTFLFLSRVYRPGEQIDRVIDITRIPNFPTGGAAPTGLARPAVPFRETDVWVQGLNVGLQLTW